MSKCRALFPDHDPSVSIFPWLRQNSAEVRVRPVTRYASIFLIFRSHWISHTIARREQPWPRILIQEWSQPVGWWRNPKSAENLYSSLSICGQDFNLLRMIRWYERALCAACSVCRVIMRGDNGYHLVTSAHNERSLQVILSRLSPILETLIHIDLHQAKLSVHYSVMMLCLDHDTDGMWMVCQNNILIRCFVSRSMHFLHHCPSRPSIFLSQKPLIIWRLTLRCLLLFWWKGLFIPRWLSQKTETKTILCFNCFQEFTAWCRRRLAIKSAFVSILTIFKLVRNLI